MIGMKHIGESSSKISLEGAVEADLSLVTGAQEAQVR
jgi:hypothetical protein